MSTNTNTELLKFFKWWLQEAESDYPNYGVTAYGLCYSVSGEIFDSEFQVLLKQIYGDNVFPFGGESQWDYDIKHDTMHLNPERIAFVKSQIERLEKLQSANQE